MKTSRLLMFAVPVLVLVSAGFWLHVKQAPSRWSDAATWGGALPRRDADVRIPAGRSVVLDVSPPRLASLIVEGRLIVADRDIVLEAKHIVVHGELSVGDARHRFAHHAQIVLDAASDGSGVLLVSGGGRVTLWGAERQTWTHLARTVAAGGRSLTLAQAVDWQRGDRLVLAPSGFAANESEEGVVSEASGRAVTLADPVRFRHWGSVTDGVDERAEVGLISHNVSVTSEPNAALRAVGGQVVVMQGGRLDVNAVEFAALGQRGRLGRYPIHFHLARDASGSTVAASSIVHSFNRCLTIHGTNNVAVRDNVAYDTAGHCFFLEDGVETGNVFERNLAVQTRGARPAEAVLETDAEPASYWIANPANTLVGNVAAGGDGNGFWYSLSPHPTGPSQTADIWPRRAALGRFAQNVAHSNADNGLFVDILRNPPGVTEAPNYSPAMTADFQTLVAYKNRKRGAWLRGTNLRLSNAVIADNSIGVTFAGANAILRDSRVVGTTENQTGPPKPDDASFPIRGFEFYDGQVGVERTQFANFVGDTQRHASALSALRFSPFFTDPTNYARALTFYHAQRVFFEPGKAGHAKLGADGYRGSVFRDVDGSVTGTPGTSVAVETPLSAAGDCAARTSWNAVVCRTAFGSVFVISVDAHGRSPGPVRVSLVSNATAGGGETPLDPFHSLLLFGNPQPAVDAIFQTNIRSGQTYSVSFRHQFPQHLRVGLHHFIAGEHLTLIFPQAPSNLVLVRGMARPGAAVSHGRNGALVLDLSTATSGVPGANVIDLCAAGTCG